jgi:O-methyltransferase
LLVLERLAREVNNQDVPGDFVECGVALGGSAIVLAESRGRSRVLQCYDVFGMIPPPTAADPPEVHSRYATIASGRSRGIGDDEYYGYRDDLHAFVTDVLAEFGHPVGPRTILHKGLFEDTLHPATPVALAHIDSDWHDAVATCLARISPLLSPGGYMVLDDYEDYGGCKKAVDEFLAEAPQFDLVRFRSNVAVHLPRRGTAAS